MTRGTETVDARALARAMRSLRRERCESRRRERVARRARLLDWLDDWVFGCRMPSVAAVVADAEWRRDALSDYCWRCGCTRAAYESTRAGCGECRTRRLDARGVSMCGTVRLGRYAPPLSRWVPAIKSRAWRDMGVHLGRELGLQALDAIDAGLLPRPDAVVSMPVHWTRRMLRGIDHARVIAEEAARVLGSPYLPALRARLAARQSGGTKGHRAGNLGRFHARASSGIAPGSCVLLVDDVRTTGSTMREGMAALGEIGVGRIVLGVCAAADPPRRSGLAEAASRGAGRCG